MLVTVLAVILILALLGGGLGLGGRGPFYGSGYYGAGGIGLILVVLLILLLVGKM